MLQAPRAPLLLPFARHLCGMDAPQSVFVLCFVSCSPPPPRAHRRGSLARDGAFASGTREMAEVPASAAAAAAEHKSGRFWRPFATHSSSSAAAAAAAAEARGMVPTSCSTGLSRSSSGGAIGMKSKAQHGGGGGRRWKLHPSSSANGSFNTDGNLGGVSPEDGGVWDTGGGGGGSDGGRGQRTQRSKRSLPGIGAWRRSSEPASSAIILGSVKGSSSSSPPPPPRSKVRQRPSSVSGVNLGADGDRGDDAPRDGARSWLPGGRRIPRERRGTTGDIGARAGAAGEEDGGGDFLETVAKVPPWMEGVEASAEYEEMKPTLDVIKRTVLLAMLQQVSSVERGRGGKRPEGDVQCGRTCVFMSVCVRLLNVYIACRVLPDDCLFDRCSRRWAGRPGVISSRSRP